MRVSRRVAAVRQQVKRLAEIAEKRAVQADSIRAAPSFRPLTESETELIVGAELLAALAAGAVVIRS